MRWKSTDAREHAKAHTRANAEMKGRAGRQDGNLQASYALKSKQRTADTKAGSEA